jgi:hypothetical protein
MNTKDTSIFHLIKRNEVYIDLFIFLTLNIFAISAIFDLQKIDENCMIQIGKEILNCRYG